jgi:cytochrome c
MGVDLRRTCGLSLALAASMLLTMQFQAQAQAQAQAADIAHGKRVFQSCSSCHAVDSDANRFGPTLKGVVGRTAGSVPTFRYSQAMKDAGANGLIWDEAALSEFLYSPKRKVPGTSMRFWGLWTQGEIDDVIAYLKSFP